RQTRRRRSRPRAGQGRASLGSRLVVGPEAAGADLEPPLLAVDREPGRVDVRPEPPLGVALGVAHVAARYRRLATKIASLRQVRDPLVLYRTPDMMPFAGAIVIRDRE